MKIIENDGMDIKLRDNIDLAQFSERFPDETMLHPGSSLGNRHSHGKAIESRVQWIKRFSSSLRSSIRMVRINDLPHTNMRIHVSTHAHIYIYTYNDSRSLMTTRADICLRLIRSTPNIHRRVDCQSFSSPDNEYESIPLTSGLWIAQNPD